jgi:hypothetical protein
MAEIALISTVRLGLVGESAGLEMSREGCVVKKSLIYRLLVE